MTREDSLSVRMEGHVQAEALAHSEVRVSEGVAVKGSGLRKRSRRIHTGEKSC